MQMTSDQGLLCHNIVAPDQGLQCLPLIKQFININRYGKILEVQHNLDNTIAGSQSENRAS